MEKSFWGPSTWCMIHAATAGYQPINKYSMKQFIGSLPYLLPCDFCKKHLFDNLRTLPLTTVPLADNRKLFMWSYFLHDLVNKQLKKPNGSPPYTDTERYYFSHSSNPAFWGPCFWRAIHSFAAAYKMTPQNKQAFKQFIYSLIGIIPCVGCREHFRKNLQQLPLTDEFLQSADKLFLWTYLLHDLVNRQLGKTSLPFETIKKEYFNDQVCKTCSS